MSSRKVDNCFTLYKDNFFIEGNWLNWFKSAQCFEKLSNLSRSDSSHVIPVHFFWSRSLESDQGLTHFNERKVAFGGVWSETFVAVHGKLCSLLYQYYLCQLFPFESVCLTIRFAGCTCRCIKTTSDFGNRFH